MLRSPGLLSRRVTSKEVDNSRTRHLLAQAGTLVIYFKFWRVKFGESNRSCTH